MKQKIEWNGNDTSSEEQQKKGNDGVHDSKYRTKDQAGGRGSELEERLVQPKTKRRVFRVNCIQRKATAHFWKPGRVKRAGLGKKHREMHFLFT